MRDSKVSTYHCTCIKPISLYRSILLALPCADFHGCRPQTAVLCWSQINLSCWRNYLAVYSSQVNNIMLLLLCLRMLHLVLCPNEFIPSLQLKVLEYFVLYLNLCEIIYIYKYIFPIGNQPEYSLEGLMLKLKLRYFGHLMQRANSVEKTLMLERLKTGREGGDRG